MYLPHAHPIPRPAGAAGGYRHNGIGFFQALALGLLVASLVMVLMGMVLAMLTLVD